jgi:hypothetical protein
MVAGFVEVFERENTLVAEACFEPTKYFPKVMTTVP